MSCKHFPQNRINDCPICFPVDRFEILPKIWISDPIVEILRNGKSWESPWDKEFQFGRLKTALIYYSLEIIEDFAIHPNPGKMLVSPFIFQPDPDLSIHVQTFSAFTKYDGHIVDEPFIRLDRIFNGKKTSHIGFGQFKASALVILIDGLQQWLWSVGGWYR
ncbi:MAG: hypothetical protein AAGU17_13615 [Anaerolineaceae bacterium]